MRALNDEKSQQTRKLRKKGRLWLFYLKIFLMGLSWSVLWGCAPLSQPELPHTITRSPITTPHLAQITTPTTATEPTPAWLTATTPITTSLPSNPPTLTPLPPATKTLTPLPSPTPVPTGPYRIESQNGKLTFTLYRPAEVDLAVDPVSHLLYTTAKTPRGITTTLWLAEVEDVTQRQVITTFYHHTGNLVSYPTLSPDNTWLAYISDFIVNPFEARLMFFNLKTKQVYTLDTTAFIRRRGGKTFLWAPDSTAIAYIEPAGELYLYQIETGHKQFLTRITVMSGTLPTGLEDMVLIDWLTADTLLYASMEDGETWDINSVNITNGNTTHLARFDGWDLVEATLSPNRNNLLVAINPGCPVLAINPQTQETNLLSLKTPCSGRNLWHPNSQGLLGSHGDEMFAVDLTPITGLKAKELVATEVVLTSPSSAYPLSWSDKGRYLIYENRTTTEGALFDAQTGHTQVIKTSLFEFVGWVEGD